MHRIKIHQGKLARLNVDAIVNPLSSDKALEADSNLGSTLRGALRSTLRSTLEIPQAGNLRVMPASADTTSAIIEAIGPIWRGGDYQEEEQLASCYKKAMDMAKQQNFRSIAFTPISCSAMGFPANRATKIAIQQVNLALRDNPLIEAVIFCCFDPVTTALYRSQVGR